MAVTSQDLLNKVGELESVVSEHQAVHTQLMQHMASVNPAELEGAATRLDVLSGAIQAMSNEYHKIVSVAASPDGAALIRQG